MGDKAKIDIRVLVLVALLAIATVFYVANAATSGTTSVSATVTSVMIEPADVQATVSPTEATTTTVYFSFIVEDPQGIANIENTSAAANITITGITRTATCSADVGVNSTAQNYSCNANMIYYDNATTWTVTVGGGNQNGTTVSNSVRTFTYSELNAMTLAPASLSNWASSWYPGAADILSSDDPLVVNQTGNRYSTNIQGTGISLVGASVGSIIIPAANFTMNTADACSTGTALVNATATQVTGAYLPSGEAVATEDLYLCMEDVPADATAQAYNSPENWVITVA